MVRASCVAAHSQPTDDETRHSVKRNAAAENDDAGGELVLTASITGGRRQELRVEGIRVVQTEERMPGLNEGIKAGR